MNCYLITNPSQKGYIDPITRYICDTGTKPVINGIITNSEDFKKIFLRRTDKSLRLTTQKSDKVFYNKSDANTVFIVPELNWDDEHSLDSGYKIALALLEGKLKNKFFNIVFVSIYPKDVLLEEVSEDYKVIVKSFPHLHLPELCLSLEKSKTSGAVQPTMPVPAYSRAHFDLLKRMVFSKSGRLSHIIHILPELKGPVPTNLIDRLKNRINTEVLDILSLSAYRVVDDWEDRIAEFRKRTLDLRDNDEIDRLIGDIEQYIYRIVPRVSSLFSTDVKNERMGYKVLIIEDDGVSRKNLKEFFETLGNTVTVFEDSAFYSNWDSGHKELCAKELIKNAAGIYNIVILDLMYYCRCGSGHEILPYNGFDLYNDLRKEERKPSHLKVRQRIGSYRKAAIRIVTSLPRQELEMLISSCDYFESEKPKYYTKRYGWASLKEFIRDDLNNLIYECETNEKNYWSATYAPKNGVLGRAGVYEVIKGDNNAKEFKAAVKYSKDVAQQKVVMKRNALPTSESTPSSILVLLPSIMAHRRLVILFVRGRYLHTFSEIEYRKFLKTHYPDKVKLPRCDKDYLITGLGFSIKHGKDTESEDNKKYFTCEIPLDNRYDFFEEEQDLFGHSESSDKVVLKWINAIREYFSGLNLQDKTDEPFEYDDYSSAGTNVRTESYSESELKYVLKEAGIQAFLSKRASTKSFSLLLDKVNAYINDGSKDKNLRNWIKRLFARKSISLGKTGDTLWEQQRKLIKKEYAEDIFASYNKIRKAKIV